MKIELKKLIENLDPAVKVYLENAIQHTIIRGGREILIEDMLYAMLQNKDSIFYKLLEQYNIDVGKMTKVLTEGTKQSSGGESGNPIFSSVLIKWFENSYMLNKLDLDLDLISEISLLYTMFEYSDHYLSTDYFSLFYHTDSKEITTLLKGLLHEKKTYSSKQNPSKTDSGVSELEKYTEDLTEAAKNGKVDPVLSRDKEIKQAIDILSRRRKNNPIMVGEAGVGKTAIVEGLALKIINRDVPKHLHNAKLLSLDLGAMQAGASIKGEFERRLQAVINEIKSSTQFIILFIDEAHTLIGAGGNEGSSDAANLLKPALARGELKTIAATTWLEYRKYFEKDPALSRRFQKIDLYEPTIEQATTILRGIASKYEEAHGVYIEDDALKAAANLSARYITGRQLPDKAIDVLDTACANVKIGKSNEPFSLTEKKNEVAVLQKELGFLQRDQQLGIKDNKERIAEIKNDIAVLEDALKRDTEIWQKQKKKLDEIEALKKTDNKERLKYAYREYKELKRETLTIHEHVTEEQIAEVISSWTGIPLGNMKKTQAKNAMDLPELLKSNVIGQDEAIEYIGRLLQISTAGLKKENVPEGVFLLVGPSGVGKTETAISIAKHLFGGDRFLTTINMTEFQEKHTVSRLIGSPPGYVGYGDGGQLTDPVRIKPYSVVLLDEIEKAHPDILNLFYQIFDKGVANDGEGREIDFSNTIIIMTSNLATKEITKLCTENKEVSMEELSKKILPLLSKYLKPALLGRLNVIPYKNLSMKALKKIAELKLAAIKNQLEEKDIEFIYDNKLLERIVLLSNTTETGARNLELIINNNIMPKLSKVVLDSMINENEFSSIIKINTENNDIKITHSHMETNI